MTQRTTGPLYRDDWLDHMYPLVSGDGKAALLDFNTPIRRYDLMRRCDGEASLRQVTAHADYGFQQMMTTFQDCFLANWVDVKLRLPHGFERFMIGEFLVSAGILTDDQLHQGLERQRALSKPLCEALRELKVLSEQHVAFALRIQTLYRLATSEHGQHLSFVQNPSLQL